MCGLVGAAGNLNGVHERVVKTLLILDVLRGEDSTGVAVIRKFDESVHIAKEIGNPFNLFETKRFDKAFAGNNKVVIGHNRFATQGGVIRRNAHPFDFDTLVGAHNGTLGSKFSLLNSKDYVVDSENLYHHIEEKGVDDAISKLGASGNAWALTWWDKQESTLNILRNKERPLYHVFTADGSVMFWASEMWMLYAALNRTDIKFGEILPIPEDMLYSFHVDKQGTLQKPHVRAVAAPKFQPVKTTTVVSTGNTTATSSTNTQLTVVGETKKSLPQVAGSKRYDPTYLGLKERTFETLSISTDDDHGGEYVVLFDPENPYYEVRMYLKPDISDILHEHVLRNGLVTGKVSQYCSRNEEGYYKVSPWGITIIPVRESKASEKSIFPTHKGTFVSAKEWQSQYPSCNWCSSPLFPEDLDNRFTTNGECICPSCATDKQVQEYVKFI